MRKVLKILSIVLICSGILLAGGVVGTYVINDARNKDIVNHIREKVSEPDANSESAGNEKTKEKEDTDSNKKSSGFREGKYDLLTYDVDKEALLKDSQAYNKALETTQGSSIKGEYSFNYAALDLTKYGIPDNIYGYVSAPSIGMQLPIYLGANEGNLAYGAGHLCYTSLPVEGETTNVVLAGHTGYIGRWLFDSIRYLNIGDKVSISTYLGTLNYKVTDKIIRVPTDSRDIYLEHGKEKLVMFTCEYASYGLYNRYMIICQRI